MGNQPDPLSRPSAGRAFTHTRRVRLGDVAPDGALRLDAIARYLQDIATDDAEDSALPQMGYWVLRRLAIEVDDVPRFGDHIDLVTWCSGTGARWAERRTDVSIDGAVRARSEALWVHVNRVSGAPAKLPAEFFDIFGPSACGRTVRTRLSHAGPVASASSRVWPTRAVDFDVLGHMNNAAYWSPLEELLASSGERRHVARAELEIRGGIDPGEEIVVDHVQSGDDLSLWLRVADEVRASVVARTAAP